MWYVLGILLGVVFGVVGVIVVGVGIEWGMEIVVVFVGVYEVGVWIEGVLLVVGVCIEGGLYIFVVYCLCYVCDGLVVEGVFEGFVGGFVFFVDWYLV